MSESYSLEIKFLSEYINEVIRVVNILTNRVIEVEKKLLEIEKNEKSN